MMMMMGEKVGNTTYYWNGRMDECVCVRERDDDDGWEGGMEDINQHLLLLVLLLYVRKGSSGRRQVVASVSQYGTTDY